jgi:hypothetical protein
MTSPKGTTMLTTLTNFFEGSVSVTDLTPSQIVERFAQEGVHPPCPECAHGRLDLVDCTKVESYHPGYHVTGRALPTREREVLAAACNGCEFMVEVA